ncbi:MAG: hypothetical protein N2578_06715, partial [Bdellovibrionaceae bacterium]|nr:hypothetical protein [Pseudobdellovibrionaceae bacterium]
AVDKALNGVISEMIGKEEISGKIGETVVFPTFGKMPQPVGEVQATAPGHDKQESPVKPEGKRLAS